VRFLWLRCGGLGEEGQALVPLPVVHEVGSTDLAGRFGELGRQLRLLLGSSPNDDVASSALFDALGELPLSVAEAWARRLVDSARAVELVEAANALQGVLHDGVLGAHARTIRQINEAMVVLARSASPVELLRRAPALLCEACGFDRALISCVRGSTWVPAALHVAVAADDEVNVALAAAIGTLEIPLTSSLIETDVLRRRSSIVVDDAATDHPLVELSRARAYVAAPIVITESVAGFLHADVCSSPRRLTSADRVSLQTFAEMFGLLYERAAMAERLVQQQQAIHSALSSAATSVAELGPHVGQLVRDEFHASAAPTHTATREVWDRRDSRRLTPREWEILGLLATGAANGQIAAMLVVSESTIKSHVKRILRKLPAANRAEAVYRYTRMTGQRSRAS
jgi:DNA-binding CsgD family transcriptional regulator